MKITNDQKEKIQKELSSLGYSTNPEDSVVKEIISDIEFTSKNNRDFVINYWTNGKKNVTKNIISIIEGEL